jgi:hypothetical protein
MVQRCSKCSHPLLAERALKTALSLFPKRHRLGELHPSGLGQRNQAIALVLFICDQFDQSLSLERDAVALVGTLGSAVLDPTETRGRRRVLLMPCFPIMAGIRPSC